MVMVGVLPELAWGTGTGIEPPARKEAGWPLVVTRLGSASTRPRLFCLRMLKNTVQMSPPALKPAMAWRLELRENGAEVLTPPGLGTPVPLIKFRATLVRAPRALICCA